MKESEVQFSEATRMPLPEMSYEQELVCTPVPFENRVAFLSEYEKAFSSPATFDQLRLELGLSRSVLRSILNDIDAPSIQHSTGKIEYEMHTKEVVAEELIWQEEFNKLNESVSAVSIAKILSKGVESVHQLAYGLGVYPDFKYNGKKLSILYPKELAQMLRIFALHHPPAGDWYSPDEAENTVGKNREWIELRVRERGLKAGMRMSRNNIMTIHYPLETINTLQTLVRELPPPAGDWMTVRHMATLVNKSSWWVKQRLSQHADLAEERLTDIYTVKIHYPPSVFLVVEQVAREIPPSAEGWLTVQDISDMLLKSWSWVDSRLKEIDVVSEMRLDTANIPRMHYHFDVIDELQLKYLIDEENKKTS